MKRVLSVFLVLLLVMVVLPHSAFALTVNSVVANPDTPNTVSNYTISITIAAALSRNADYISVQFANEFYVPTTINKNAVRVNGVLPYNVSVSGKTVRIYPGQDLAANGSVNIQIYSSAGIKNPPVGGRSYDISVSTSKEAAQTYPLYIQQTVRSLTVIVSPLSSGSIADYAISFVPNVSLYTNDHIYVKFPSGTVLPSTINASYVLVNGYHCSSVTRVGNLELDIKTPVNCPANYTASIDITTDFGVQNPPAGTYTIQLATNKEPAFATSNSYTIVQSNIKNLTVSVSPNTAYAAATYSIWFVTGPNGALTGGDYIKITFPQGTQIPNGSPNYITINGVSVASRYVNGETLTIYLPNNLSVGNNSSCNVLISSNYGIKNPPPGLYTLTLSTNRDVIPATSNKYNIVGTSISNLNVTLKPNTQNANSECTIAFVTSSGGALSASSGKIFVEFPQGFKLPSYFNSSYVLVNGSKAYNVTISNRKVTIITPVYVGNNSNVTVVFKKEAGIRNPDNAGTYSFSVYTSADSVSVSYEVHIVKSHILNPTVKLSSNGVGKNISITVSFVTGASGALQAGVDKILIKFPVGFYLPHNIPVTSVKINNMPVSYVRVRSGSVVEIRTPVYIYPNSTVTAVIDKSAGIKNPKTTGDYYFEISTTAEPTWIKAEKVTIVALPTVSMSVNPENPDGLNGYYKTHPIVILTASSPIDPHPVIYYYFDSGSPTVYTSPISVPDGVHTLYCYAVDNENNKSDIVSKKFKVDTIPPKLTILSPKNNEVLNTHNCVIKGKTEKGATVTVNGKSVDVLPDGSFTYSQNISEKTAFVIKATDQAGNVTTVNLTVSVDTTPPKLTVFAPVAFQVIHSQFVTVKGKTEKNAKVTVNGISVPVNPEDYSFSYTLTLSKEGLNTISVVATDLAGNKTKVSIPVKLILKTTIILQIGNKYAVVNGEKKLLEAPPLIVKNRTLVPIRFISEAFGAKIQWYPVFKLVFITLNNRTIILQIGKSFASINDKKVMLDAPPLIIKNHTMVPLRFIAEAFGAKIVWDNATRSITITYP